MSITYDENSALFEGTVSVEEAETLVQWIQKHPHARVDLTACSHLHAADLQALMAARIPIAAWPRDDDLSAWLKAALE